MATLAETFVEVKPDTRNFQSHLRRDLGRVNAAPSGAMAGESYSRGFGTGLRRMASLGATAVAGITGALATAGAAAGMLGIRTAAANENAEIAFTTMLKSGDKARAFLDDLKTFAASTPFEFPQLQQASSSLISIGVETDKIIPIMTTLGNVTAGMGTGSEGIRRATVALQQMNAAGRITAEDLNQLRDAGIPVFDLLTAATGKTREQLAEMSREGKLGRKELEQLMSALETGKGMERFAGMMDKQSQSLQGLWSTLKDTFSQGMAEAIAPSLPILKQGLGGAIKFLEASMPGLQAGLKGATETIMEFIHGASLSDPSIGRPLTDVEEKGRSLRKMFLVVKQVWDGLFMEDPSIGRPLTDLEEKGRSLRKMFGLIRDAAVELWDKITAGGGGDTAGTWDRIKESTSGLLDGIMRLAEELPGLQPTFDAVGTVAGFLADHMEEIGTALPYVLAGIAAIKGLQAAGQAWSASAPGIALQTGLIIAQTAAQFSLAGAIRGQTAAQVANNGVTQAGIAARARSMAGMVAHRVATAASAVATGVATAAQWLFNAALTGARWAWHAAQMVAYRAAQMAVRGATMAWTAVQWLLNAALTANPIGLVIAAIALLVAGIVIAYKKSDTFRDAITRAFKQIQEAGKFMWERVLKPLFKAWVNVWFGVVGAIIDGAAKAFGWVPGLGPKLKAAQKKFHEFKDSVNASLNKLDDKEITISAKFRATYGLRAGGATITPENRDRRWGVKRGGPIPHLPGSVPREDSVDATLVPGEYVVREDGSNLSDAIRHFSSRRGWRRPFKDGGLVPRAYRPSQRDVDRVTGKAWAPMADTAAKRLAALAQARLDREMAALASRGGSTFGTGVGHALSRVRAALLSGLTITSTYRSPAHNAAVGGSPTSLHMNARNPAVDIGGPTYLLDRMYAVLRQMGGWRQLFWRVAGHYDHIHVADTGGMISPGKMGLNLGNRPERILSAQQTEAFERLVDILDGRGGAGFGPRTLVIVDKDGDLIGRMRVEAGDVLDEELAAARWGNG